MANLRILSITVVDSTDITARFTAPLSENIGIDNVLITSQTPGVPDSAITGVTVVNDTLKIVMQPLTPMAAYFIMFQSVTGTPFQSLNGTATLFSDGVTNRQLIIGPTEDNNPIKEYLTNFLTNNVYNLESPSMVSSYIDVLSTVLAQALYDVRQVKNENYLSYTIVDEQHQRGNGAFDRLNEEAAYDILRVGTVPTGTTTSSATQVASFPSYLVSLRATGNTENLAPSVGSTMGTINLENLTLNLSKNSVIILNSVTFVYSSSSYTYDIDQYGYQIYNSNYDPDFAFTYLQLSGNQIRLNSEILSDPTFSLENINYVQANYQFKDTGKNIDPTTLSVDTVLYSGREVVPPIENVFTLQHAPIVTTNDQIGTVGSVTFTDPNEPIGSGIPHPAFVMEIPFSLNYLPSIPGQYAVDYSNSNVYVYGASASNDGTGPYPPIATYSYRYVFSDMIDYVYDTEAEDLAALPNGSLIEAVANIYYMYEEVLAPGVDYNVSSHVEVLDEFVNNSIVALNAIQPQNFPVTDVFRIYNQTTGEVYPPVRWSDNLIYFSYNTAPNIEQETMERASFDQVLNEIMFVTSSTVVSPSTTLFEMDLANNNIIAATEDCIGSSINTTVSFSDTIIFVQEIYFDNNLSLAENNSRLLVVGDYQVDYIDGIVYCLVSNTQNNGVGSVSYKRGYIDPQFPHVITVEDIYYSIGVQEKKVKTFAYTSFTDGSILPSTFDLANESILNNNIIYPYQLHDDQVGTFGVGAVFVPGVSNTINFIRGLYEYTDLLNNTSPINFGSVSVPNGNSITVSDLVFQEYHTVQYNGTHYYVMANTDLLYQSPNILMTVTITRLSDSLPLWNGSGTITLGSPFLLILPGINSPNIGDAVNLTYSYTIVDLSRVVVNYDKGGYYFDYTALIDELILSYEYGDNALDFRTSTSLYSGETYYVTYKVGALRDALLKNFGTLINIPILNSLDVALNRERYRDCLIAAMQSFITGPSVTSMASIVQNIVHTPPTIIESAFQNWTIGQALLNPQPIQTSGSFSLVPAKYDFGVVMDTFGQEISMPMSSNLRLEQGTLECWIAPQWNGIDNQSEITFNITKDGYLLPPQFIFIGPGEFHPQYAPFGTTFSLNTKNLTAVQGKPNQSKDGVFIYYAPDSSGLFNRWFVDVKDGYWDGYYPGGYVDGYYDGYAPGQGFDGYSFKNYSITVNTSGKFYDVKSDVIPAPASSSISSGTNSFVFNINGSIADSQGVTFVADNQHYIIDAGQQNRNRLSLFKDESGYINFRIIDKRGRIATISYDVSSWVAGALHQLAASWELGTADGRDEMHLFIDGFEVPNIIKYDGKITPYLHEKYRTIDPEEIVGMIHRPIVGSTDLVTTAGSNVVSSSINFSEFAVLPGDTLYIEEAGFSTAGYTIDVVFGQQLTLATVMPITMANGTYTVNKASLQIVTEPDAYPNIIVLLLHSSLSGTDLVTTMGSPTVSSVGTNFQTQGVQPGSLLLIENAAFPQPYTIVSVSGHTLTLTDSLANGYSGVSWVVYPNSPVEIPGVNALNPAYQLSKDGYCNNVLTIVNDALVNDIVLIETLGLDSRGIDQKYYVWGSSNNVVMTKLPAPITLCEAEITHWLLSPISIGPPGLDGYTQSTAIDGYFQMTPVITSLISGNYLSNDIYIDQPSTSDNGRTLSVYITGDNVNYSTPVFVSIYGTINGVPSSMETLAFSENSIQNTTFRFSQVSYVVIQCTPINTAIDCVVMSIKEAYPITTAEDSVTVPVIRYSYQVAVGNSLYGTVGMNTVTDPNGFFSAENIGNYLIITSPSPVAGQYQILNVFNDNLSVTLSSNLAASFTGGQYQVLNVSDYRSGLQNGFFTFENATVPGQPYNLVQGIYEFDYFTYLSLPFDTGHSRIYVGTDINGKNIAHATIDELVILSDKLSDTRIGESVAINQESVTKDFNSLVPLVPSPSTLVLCHFDTFPFVNSAGSYILASNKFIQSSDAVNDNFGKSIVFTETPMVINNTGILNTPSQGTIEFWVNPLYDTGNDPNYRFYFDATALTSQKVISTNNATVVVSGQISEILNVKLQVGDDNVDYFAGGTVGPDNQTIYLNRRLPNQQTPVVVNYIPSGTQGDRMSIYKDPSGYINFDVRASGIDYIIRSPVYWPKDSWHRLKATFQMNSGIGSDQIHFFVDGYERGNVVFGSGLLFGQGQVFGSSYQGRGGIFSSISFKDTINEFFIGSDFTGANNAYVLIDNLRISNIARPVFAPYGESIDVNYNRNLNIVLPVTSDLYTTLLLDFNTLISKNTSFSTLKNKNTGQFDFTMDIYDSFDILKDNPIVKTILETLIDTLKPANTQAIIAYINE